MNREIEEELKYLGFVALGLVVIMQLVFYKENFGNTLRLSGGLLYVLVIPGFLISLNLPLERFERTIVGVSVMVAILGIILVYFGYIGVQVKASIWIIPGLVILGAAGWYVQKKGVLEIKNKEKIEE